MDQSIYLIKAQEILRRLNELGHEAYFVGGVVRDQLLKIPFTDIDITTSATPEQVLEVVPDANKEYMDLGVISFKFDGMDYEITTFRTETYTNIRKPSQVHYSTKLREDLDRRDFTINALAMSPNGKIYDLCEGTKDLKNKIIRIIGKGKVRFKEDPLRILRAFTLVSKLNFHIEPKTATAIMACRKEVRKLTEAKVIAEVTKIFQGQHASKAIKLMLDSGVAKYLPLKKKALKILKRKINKVSIEEAFAICYKIEGSVSANANFSHNSYKRLQTILEVSSHLESSQVDDTLIYKYGTEIVLSANTVNRYVIGRRYKSQEKQIKRIANSLPIKSKADLAFKGEDVLALTGGRSGPIIGEVLSHLEEKVLARELPNEYHKLKEYASEFLKRVKVDSSTFASGAATTVVPPVETQVPYTEYQKEESEPVVPTQSFETNSYSNNDQKDFEEISLAEKEARLKREWQQLMVERYKQDFNKMVNANINSLPNAATLTPEERANLASQMAPSVRQMLININIDYQKLAREGII